MATCHWKNASYNAHWHFHNYLPINLYLRIEYFKFKDAFLFATCHYKMSAIENVTGIFKMTFLRIAFLGWSSVISKMLLTAL